MSVRCCRHALAEYVWLQVEPGAKPGQLDVWALIDTAMHKMTVEVPRKIYVDVAASAAHLLAGARRVDRTLPDGSQPAVLLELELPEEELIGQAKVRSPCGGGTGAAGAGVSVSPSMELVPNGPRLVPTTLALRGARISYSVMCVRLSEGGALLARLGRGSLGGNILI